MLNAFTVDVEEWFHICGAPEELAPDRWNRLPSRVVETTTMLLDLLDRRGVQGTFFVLGWVANRHPQLMERIAEAGHEIGSHGYGHVRAYELGPAGFQEDLNAGLSALQATGVARATAFRAPEWSINDRSLWALDVLARRGFRIDSSMAALRLVGNPAYPQEPHVRQTASGPILECPPFVTRRFGQQMPLGGSWGLRMTAPSRVCRAIEQRNREGHPVVLYVHPWEIDPDPPRVALPWPLRFAHYFRLADFASRLDDILRAVPFAPLNRAMAPHEARFASIAGLPDHGLARDGKEVAV